VGGGGGGGWADDLARAIYGRQPTMRSDSVVPIVSASEERSLVRKIVRHRELSGTMFGLVDGQDMTHFQLSFRTGRARADRNIIQSRHEIPVRAARRPE